MSYSEEEFLRQAELAFDPEFWETRAEQARNLSEALGHQPRFAAALLKHAAECDKLAQAAYKLRQDRTVQRRTLPQFRRPNLVSLRPGELSTGTDGE